MPLAAPILAAGIAMKALGGSVSGTIKGMGTLVGQFQKLRKTGFIESAKQQGTQRSVFRWGRTPQQTQRKEFRCFQHRQNK